MRRLPLQLVAAAALAAGACLAHPAAADTITGYIDTSAFFNQTSDSVPPPSTTYVIGGGAFYAIRGDFTSGTVTYPGLGSPQTLTYSGGASITFSSGAYTSLADLHADYPFGTYSVTVSGPGGTQTSTFDYPADYFGSPTPYLQNYSSLQGINPLKGITVTYPAFTPNSNTNGAFIFFTIFNESMGGAVVYSNPYQSPTSTSSFIPAGTFTAGDLYDFDLDYQNSLSGVDGTDGTFTDIAFDLRTDGLFTAGPAVPEPASWLLLAGGIAGLVVARRSKRRSA